MSQMNKLYLGTMKLLSQSLAELDPLYQQTACLGAEEREVICVLEAYAKLIEVKHPDKAKRLRDKLIPFIETIGVGKWIRFELTDLGLKVGSRNVEKEDQTIISEEIDEATVFATDNNKE
jgi:hypothetical protein